MGGSTVCFTAERAARREGDLEKETEKAGAEQPG